MKTKRGPLDCDLCEKGFPIEGLDHHGTQALGMIPATRCRAEVAILLRESSQPAELGLVRTTLGVRCLQARVRLELSQRGLAQLMGRSPSWIREIERGDQFAPPYLVRGLARATGLSVAWFYGEESKA